MNASIVNKNSLISVIVTCFNDGLFLKECIDSVVASTYKNVEIIIVDDCSTDLTTISILNDLEASGNKVLKKNSNKGVGDSRNIGIQHATASYILTVDADDFIQETYIEKAMQQLENGFSVVYCNVKNFGVINSIRIAPEFSESLLLTGNFIASCSAFTKEIWTKTGGFDVSMECYEDWEFWINCSAQGAKFIHLNEVLFSYRRKSFSRNSKCQNPAIRSKIVEYVSLKHIDFYSKYIPQVISNLHGAISTMELDISRLEEVATTENKMELFQKLKNAENQLSAKIDYYENSFYWKLKKKIDILRGR